MRDIYGKTKILVLDDERLIRLTISAKLKKIGYVPVTVGSVDEAVSLIKADHHAYRAIITDIVMGDMDGFVFRDIVRGIDPMIPIFFMTALDPEEGSGFLKRIVQDQMSYYLPKSVSTEVLLKRVQSIVASRKVEQFIERQMAETRHTRVLASHIQRSMLPMRVLMTPRGFYTTWWHPKDTVSGDLYECVPFGMGCYLYVLGDIQGHGTSAALAMTAVQSFLKNLMHREGAPMMSADTIANLLHGFFRENLADVSYMTALICIHRPLMNCVEWISCGAPDLVVMDPADEECAKNINPDHIGGLPIGLFPDTSYGPGDVVHTTLSKTAVCIAYTDGLYDMSRDEEGVETIPMDFIKRVRNELVREARFNGSILALPYKFITACEDSGYGHCPDDVTGLVFGARIFLEGIYEAAINLSPMSIDAAAQEVGDWCERQGWDRDLIDRIQLVLEENLMNVFDHGFDDRERLHEAASIRLRKMKSYVELTVWECGTTTPSIAVPSGDSSTALELINRDFSNHGRGRLIIREICDGIERNRYGNLNETVFLIPLENWRYKKEQ